MVDELISRKALLAEMRRSGKAAYLVVQDAPTVDAVEVVRCKDCTHNPDYKVKAKNMVWCRQWRTYVSNTGFCNHGERREDDGSAQI